MKKYIFMRILRSIVSIFLVTTLTYTIIYTMVPRRLIFKQDPNYNKIATTEDKKTNYENTVYERMGYIDYYDTKELQEKAKKENKSVTEVTTESVSDTSFVETPKVSEPIVEAPVVHEEVKPSILSVSHDQSNTYPVGQCTWGVKSLAPWVGNYWGNANQWGDSARRAGFRTGHTPQVGSVIVFPNVMYEGENYGHVAYVTAVNSDGTIEVLEANWGGNQQIGNYRGAFTPSSDAYYIYPNN